MKNLSNEPIFDFEQDAKAHFSRYLQLNGYKADSLCSFAQLALQYFNVFARAVEPRKRRVFESSEFYCPVENQPGYNALKRKILSGDNVNPNLSTQLLDANFQDRLMWDWKIYHFHLGQVQDQNGFASRTGPLLFAFITSDKFLSIQVLDHSHFNDHTLLTIIHRNWPDVLLPWRTNGNRGFSNIQSGELKKFRSAGCNVAIEIERGVVYRAIGGGYTGAGTSMNVHKQCDYWQLLVRFLENWARENVAIIRQHLREKALIVPDPLRLKLLIKEDGVYIMELQSKIMFHFPDI